MNVMVRYYLKKNLFFVTQCLNLENLVSKIFGAWFIQVILLIAARMMMSLLMIMFLSWIAFSRGGGSILTCSEESRCILGYGLNGYKLYSSIAYNFSQMIGITCLKVIIDEETLT